MQKTLCLLFHTVMISNDVTSSGTHSPQAQVVPAQKDERKYVKKDECCLYFKCLYSFICLELFQMFIFIYMPQIISNVYIHLYASNQLIVSSPFSQGTLQSGHGYGSTTMVPGSEEMVPFGSMHSPQAQMVPT